MGKEILDLLTAGGYGLAALSIVGLVALYRQVRESEAARIALLREVVPLLTQVPPAVETLHSATERLAQVADRLAAR